MEVLLSTGVRTTPLTHEEEFLLKLAAYLLRAGRIDESSHEDAAPDDYYTRSAMIFEAYARQLKCSTETVAWIRNLIVNSCKPVGVRDPAIDENQKWKKCWDFLVAAHELDLIRCFSRAEIDRRILLNTRERLAPYGFSTQEVNRLLLFSKKLCEATGCSRTYDNHPGNSQRFKICSREGKRCWNVVKNIL